MIQLNSKNLFILNSAINNLPANIKTKSDHSNS